MSESNSLPRFVSPAQVAELLDLTVEDVMSLVLEGSLEGSRLGASAQWRIASASVTAYLDEQREEARRIALWRQSSTASFPEIWGGGR